MIQLLGTFYANTGGGGGGGPAIPDFTYTGEYQLVNEDDGNWKVYLTSSGTFTPGVDMLIDAFYVSGGGGGASGYKSGMAHGQGGGGGGSGYTHTSLGVVLQANVAYPVVIGSGGAGGNYNSSNYYGTDGSAGGATSAFGINIQGGSGGAGGNNGDPGLGGAGGNTGGNAVSNSNGLSGGFGALATLEFGEAGGVKYSGGGGGGGAYGITVRAGGDGGAGGSTDNTGGGSGLPAEQSSPQQTGPYGAQSGQTGSIGSYYYGGGGGYGGGYGGGGGGGGGAGNNAGTAKCNGGNGAPGILVLRTHRTPATESGSDA